MTKTETTDRLAAHQTFTFEVRLKGVGMDFSMGAMTDTLRKAITPAMSNIAKETRVECFKIEVEK